jgi:hypothetical protein
MSVLNNKINKLILVKENDFQDTQKVEYREYEWDPDCRIIIHKSLKENILKDKLLKMRKDMVFNIHDESFDLNKDIGIGLMYMNDLNPEEEAQKKAADEKEARLQALQDKINKRMRDKKR